MLRGFTIILLLLSMVALGLTAPARAQREPGDLVALAYVREGTVALADATGEFLTATGPALAPWQSAKLFRSPDGDALYVATRQGLFVTGAEGGAAVRLPGEFGLTVTIARHGGVLYNLDTENIQELENNLAAFPLRETNVNNLEGGRGRLLTYLGAYDLGTANVNAAGAAALYARDAGLLNGGRPRIYPTYGGSLFYSCCFPQPGMYLLELGSLTITEYDPSYITGASALNATASRLAAPTTDGLIRIIDLISSGSRDYVIDVPGGVGPIERMAWSLDESSLFFISRLTPNQPLELLPSVTYPADTRSARGVLWRLDLVTGRTTEVAQMGDVYGVSSLAVTGRYVFAVAVEPNRALVEALNMGALPPDIQPNDPALDAYNPRTVLWRVDLSDNSLLAMDEGIWGVVARPAG